MRKSKKEILIEKMLKKEIGNEIINININKYNKYVGPLPKIASLKNNSALKTFAKNNDYKLVVEDPKIYLLKNN